MNKNLAIFVPMANEENNAEKLIKDIFNYERFFNKFKLFIIIDNVSKDNTIKIVKNLEKEFKNLKLIWAPENKNVVEAYIKGYKTCLETNYEWILELDAGNTHNPSDFKYFLPEMDKDYDCILGSRFCKKGKMLNASYMRIILSLGGSYLTKLFFKINLKDTTSGFQLFRRRVLNKIIAKGIISRDRFFQTEIKIYLRKMKIKEMPISYTCQKDTKNFPLKIILESIFLLFKLRIMKENYINE